MKRAEFVKAFGAARKRSYKKQVEAGTMRASEAAMGMLVAGEHALRAWRKHRAAYVNAKPEEIWTDWEDIRKNFYP